MTLHILKIHEYDIDGAIYLVFAFSQQYFAIISLEVLHLLILLENGIPPALISFSNYLLPASLKYCISLLLLCKKISLSDLK